MNEISIACFLISILLVIHHAYIHPNYKGLDRFFQLSDVGNFKTFNHETFVILFFVLGIISWGNRRFPL